MAERLADHTTLRLGGPARAWVRATTEDELIAAVSAADAAGEPVLVLGGGSNLVVADEGFDGTVVEVATTGVSADIGDSDDPTCGGAVVTVAAGESWDDLVARAVDRGWVGVEALSGIPGSVGATPIQNVGAYGQEVAQTLASVRVWDRKLNGIRTFAVADCGFGYRTSRFKIDRYDANGGRHLVLSVTFQLRQGTLERAGRRTPSWPAPSASSRASGRRSRRSGRRCWGCAAARAWCSTPRTTTRGARARSSPTRWCRPPTSRTARRPGPRRTTAW